jgi:hypothetical protein
MNWNIILLVITLVCFLASAVGVTLPRCNLQSLGLLFLTVWLAVLGIR